MSTTPDSLTPPARRFTRRRLLLFAGLGLLSILLIAALLVVYYIRSGWLNRYVAREIEAAMLEYGLRAQVGGFEIGWGPRTATLRDVKIYNQQTGQEIATIDRAVVVIEVRQQSAFSLRREVVFKRLDVEGLNARVELDEQGRSNLAGLHQAPPRAPSRITFDFSSLVGALTRGSFHLSDKQHNIAGELGDLKGEVRPQRGSDPPKVGVQFTSGTGRFTSAGHDTSVNSLEFAGNLLQSGAEIERLVLHSTAADATVTGRLDNWEALGYQLKAQAQVRLDETLDLFAPEAGLKGVADFNGTIEGQDKHYRVSGQVKSDELIAAGVILRGAQANDVRVEPQNDQLNFSAARASAASVSAKGARLSNAVVSGVNGFVRDGRTQLAAGQATVARVDAAQGQAAGITLRNINASFGAGKSETRGQLALASARAAKIQIGQTSGQLLATQSAVSLNNFKTSLLGGRATGNLTVQLAGNAASRLQAQFTGLKTSEVFSILAVNNAPLAGTVEGRADVSWPGTNARLLGGNINAQFTGQTSEAASAIPLTGTVVARAQRGVFNFDELALKTNATTVNATGSLAPDGNSNLSFTVTSTKAEELQTIAAAFEPVKKIITEYEPQILGDFKFEGTLTGPLSKPTVAGDLNVASLLLHDEPLGSVGGRLFSSPDEIRFENGTLTATNGGTATINYAAPLAATATTGRLDATFKGLSVDSLVAAGGFALKQKLIAGDLSGEAHLTGLPAAPHGSVNVDLANATFLGQPANAVTANVNFDEKTARLERVVVQLPQGRLSASGTLDLQSRQYQVQGQAEQLSLAQIGTAAELENVQLAGTINGTFQASGDIDKTEEFKIELDAAGQQVAINGRDAGEVKLKARTSPGGRIDLDLTTSMMGNQQPLTASIELRKPGRPIEVRSDLAKFDLGPVLAIFAPGLASSVTGQVTGTLRLSGPLVNEQGEMTAEGLRGNLSLTEVTLQVEGNPVTIATPFTVALNNSQLNIESTRITAQGTDLRFGGTLGLREGSAMNFALSGAISLAAFNRPGNELSVGGTVVIDARAGGTLGDPKLSGEARLENISVTSLSSPVTLEDGTGRIVLAGDQVKLESFTAHSGDGTVEASGAAKLAQLQPSEWNFNITATDVDVMYQGVRALAGGKLVLAGNQQGQTLSGTINVPLAEYTSDFDFTETAGGRGGFNFGGFRSSPAGGGGGFLNIPPLGLDVHIEARDSFLIRNKQANTVASASLTLGGTINEPDVSGRVTLEGGTITFRDHRYDITTGTLELFGGFGVQPELNLTTESDISGYHVLVGFNGPLNDLEVSLRSEPQLARTEIISLITTGRTESGTLNSDTIVRSGIGSAASLLSEELISKPIGREAERLLGFNRFQVDPVLRPNANPAARLTIGRQLARNLTFTYSTNLAAEQDQTAIFEYSLTNRFSAIASYTQGGSATQQGTNGNDFTIEVRGRKRFSLGADQSNNTSSNTAVVVPRFNRRPLPPAAVDVNKPDELKLSNDRMRELLPVMREGYSRALVRLGERNLTNYLQEKGYFFAEVSARCEPADCSVPDKNSKESLRVLYDVSPGLRYNLSDIRIEGTKELRKRDVIEGLQSQESSPLGGIPFLSSLPFVGGYARGITSNDRLRNDREQIREQMVDLGYRSARVDTRRAVSPDGKDLVVVFDVTEGPRSVVEDVAVRGNSIATTTELRKAVPISNGDAFSPTSIRTGAQQIRDYYMQRGYLDAKTQVEVVDLPDNRVRLVYDVSEGERAVVQRIEVTGQAISREDSIRRFFIFKPGDVLTPQLIRRTQRDMYSTGAFREVNIRQEPLAGGDETARRVSVNVTEAKPLLLVYGLGYSTDDGPRVLGQLTHTNLFGRVISGSLKLRGSRREQLAQLDFTDLRPFGHNWPTTFSAFYNRDADLRSFVRRRLVGGGLEPNTPGRSFGINRFATFIQTERKLGEQTSLRFRYSFENAKLFNLQNIPQIEVTRNEQAIRLGLFSAGISRDTRDSALNATRGQLISADHSIAARVFGGNESFNKFFGTYQRYETLPARLPVLGNSVIAFSARIGLAKAFRVVDRNGDGVITEPEERLPISERFFAGGATTLRGFRFEEAGPQGILEPRDAKELPTLVPIGGDAMAVFNFELRYPLTRRLRLVPFYDLGNVFRRVSDISFGRMTNTVGVGLRINTPLGPIGVDYGFLLDPPSFVTQSGGIIRQPNGVFHVRLGQTF